MPINSDPINWGEMENARITPETDYQSTPSSNKIEEKLSDELRQRVIKELTDAGISESSISEITLILEDASTSTTIAYPHGAITVQANIPQIYKAALEEEIKAMYDKHGFIMRPMIDTRPSISDDVCPMCGRYDEDEED